MPKHLYVLPVALLAVLGGCTGRIDTGASSDRDLPRVERGTVPMRALTERELANALSDLFPDVTIPPLTVPAAAGRDRYTTFAASQVVTSATLNVIEGSAERAATAIVDGGGLGCAPESEGRACLEAFASRVLPLLQRRAVSASDVTRFGDLFETLRRDDDARTSAILVVEAALFSPATLYLWVDARERAPGERRRLSGHELAERLSFALWASVPDPALLTSARNGRLDEPDGLEGEARRMMNDPRFDRFVVGFLTEWLGITEIDHVTKDRERIAEWEDDLGPEMRAEAEAFFRHWGRRDGTLSGLFGSRRRFASPRLAAFLGIPELGSEDGDGVLASDPEQASGIFTLSAFLAAHSRPSSRFGPTLRGHWMRTRLMCGVIGTPPVTALMRAPTEDLSLPTRAWHEALMENDGCASCHGKMDGLGFSLEHFDGAGRFRELDARVPVDASATVVGSGDRHLDGDYASIVELAPALAASGRITDCVAQHLAEYVLGTDQSRAGVAGVASSRSIAIRDVADALETADLREALAVLLTSEAFTTAGGPNAERLIEGDEP